MAALRRTLIAFALLLVTLTSSAQTQIPSPAEFLGYSIGARFTPHHRILDYFEELASRSELVTLEQIGETYEHRPLVLATIASAKHRASLDAIRRNAAALARGEGNIEAIVSSDMPAIVWLAFGVHGNESSSAEAAMLTAAALVRDPEMTKLLENIVVVIDPLSNPDGRERYIGWYQRTRGMKANPDPQAYEHQEPWPGGRYNHYLIDMNRDWAWLSQKETQARVAAYSTWHPQVYVDFHEMSAQSSYFFPPDARPMNANLPDELEKWLETFGRANAAEFSQRGWTFFVGERFDLFYPGYGDSWPSLRGAVGMTYEVAGGGRAGTTIERDDETILTLAERVDRHATTAIATLRTAAQNREGLLRFTHGAARGQIETGTNTYLIVPGSPSFSDLVGLLQRHGLHVTMLSAPQSLRASRVDRDANESKTFPAGTAVVSTKQPLGALANTLLERQPALEREFVEEQRARADADEPDDFYDLTAWALPLAMNVETWVTTQQPPATVALRLPSRTPFRAASYGYVVDGLDPNVYRLAGQLLEDEIRFSVASAPISFDGRTFARGSIVILKGNNVADLDAKLGDTAARTGATLAPLTSGWSGETSIGSQRIRGVRPPKIALVGGPGSDPTSYGMLWHTLDVDTPIPHTTLSTESLRSIDLDDYRVLIFPDGSYADRLGKSGVEKVKQWVAEGGVVVAVKGASAFLREKDVEISKLRRWEPPKDDDEDDDSATVAARYHDFRVPGAAFRTSMNERSYLTFGVPRAPAVLVEGSTAFLPVAHAVDNILTIDSTAPLLSGVAWDESLERVAGSVYVVSEKSGQGQVVTFADDPHFRLFWRATLPIFLNAVLYGPSFPR